MRGSLFFCETVQAWTAVCQEAYAMASELKMDSGGRKEGRKERRMDGDVSRFQLGVVIF